MKTSDHTYSYHEYFANVKSALAHKMLSVISHVQMRHGIIEQTNVY